MAVTKDKVLDVGNPPAIELARKKLVEKLAGKDEDVGLGRDEEGNDALVVYPRDGGDVSMSKFEGFPVIRGADNLADDS